MEEGMSNISMENLAITRLCLAEILENKEELKEENELQNSISYELELNIRNLRKTIDIINEMLEDYR